jgi:hypothetical protein
MAREKEATSRAGQKIESPPQKKPYTKPELRKLGTVRELTCGNTHTGIR